MNKLVIGILLSVFFFHCKNDSTIKRTSPQIAEGVITDSINHKKIVFYECAPEYIQFFLKDENGQTINNHGNLLSFAKRNKLDISFAMNGGMYLSDYSPQGLYIEKGIIIQEIDQARIGYGNFYMQPNGLFYLTKDKKAKVIKTEDYQPNSDIQYATQSGPMLLINGKRHPKFIKDSKHLHIRNGVGILPNGNLLFAMSVDSVNFYEFASYFKKRACLNALYLDGAISKTYLPSKGLKQKSGNFGVIIAEVRKKQERGG